MLIIILKKFKEKALFQMYNEYVILNENKEVILNCSVLSNKNTEFTKYLLDNIVKDYFPVTGYIIDACNKKHIETQIFKDSQIFYDKLNIDLTLNKLDTLSKKQYLNEGSLRPC